MIVRWSTVNVHAEGVYDVWYACPHCGHSAWARARGAGLGSDTALYVKASNRVAAINANVAANHDAERLVYASPCPRCKQHHPQIVAWAAAGEKKAATRRVMRIVSTAGAGVAAAVMIPFALWASFGHPMELTATLGLLVAVIGFGYLPFGLWRELKPVAPPWSVFDRKPDAVEFLHEDPYRGAAPKHATRTDQP